MIVEIIFIVFFILLGIVFFFRKGFFFLIAGYNTMPKKKTKKNMMLFHFVSLWGKVMFITAFSILLFILSDVLGLKLLYYIGLILICVTPPIFAIFYANIGDKFKNTND